MQTNAWKCHHPYAEEYLVNCIKEKSTAYICELQLCVPPDQDCSDVVSKYRNTGGLFVQMAFCTYPICLAYHNLLQGNTCKFCTAP